MKFTQRDLLKLRTPALVAAVLIGIALLFAGWTGNLAQQAKQQHNSAANRKTQIEQRLLQVSTEEQEIKDRISLFLQLEKSGLTGEEKRLDWTELLRELQHELLLPGMSYEFGPQSPLEKAADAGYAYYSSPLKIQLRLLHEEDLLNFITRLQKEAKALVIVRSCKLNRQAKPGETGNRPALLAAECEMEWITLRRPAAPSS